jgi:tetratricopeptide (TPR) repeat protein
MTSQAKDWYRNKTWNDDIEAMFFDKLSRARTVQYITIQAGMLAKTEPTVALRLIDYYLATGDKFHMATAHSIQATAWQKLGNRDKVIESFRAALAHEREMPGFKTGAELSLPFLITTNRLTSNFSEAKFILNSIKSLPPFPLSRFKFHASLAIIYEYEQSYAKSTSHAKEALAAACAEKSGIARHQDLGLVGQTFSEVRHFLARLAMSRF